MLVTDLFQFALKMTMIVVLAWLAVSHLGGMHALKVQLAAVDAGDARGRAADLECALVPAGFSCRSDDREYLDAAAADVPDVPGRAVVGGVVSGSGAGRRRVHCAAHVQREE